jgi:DNA-binding CsgD family transcriptional regulator
MTRGAKPTTLAGIRDTHACAAEARLTPRQRETFELLLAGLSAKSISDRLEISVNTAAQYTKAVLRIFGVHSRATLLACVLGGPTLSEPCRAEPEPPKAAADRNLSPRQRETLGLLLAGLSNKDIAARLGVSAHTASQYTKSLFRHFGVGSRGALLALVLGGHAATLRLPTFGEVTPARTRT